jgi:hypothetical protein
LINKIYNSQKLPRRVKPTKRYILEPSDDEFNFSTSGIALVALALNRFTNISVSLAKAAPLFHGISHTDVMVIRVTERTNNKKGQPLLLPEIEVEERWTTLKLSREEVISLD